jgi:hypothetical protein
MVAPLNPHPAIVDDIGCTAESSRALAPSTVWHVETLRSCDRRLRCRSANPPVTTLRTPKFRAASHCAGRAPSGVEPEERRCEVDVADARAACVAQPFVVEAVGGVVSLYVSNEPGPLTITALAGCDEASMAVTPKPARRPSVYRRWWVDCGLRLRVVDRDYGGGPRARLSP